MGKVYVILAAVFILIVAGGFIFTRRSKEEKIMDNTQPPVPESNQVQGFNTLDSATPAITSTPTSAPTATASPKTWSAPPAMEIDAGKTYTAILHTTAGDITVTLNSKATPVTVNNFVFLARQHFYDKTIFHRVIKGFMIQGGDPKGDGTGGPGYRFNDELVTGSYTRGTVAMANAGPNTNGSQFFIMHADYALPKNYVIFGLVSAGLETVDKIASAEVTTSPTGEDSKPVNPVTVTSVEIFEK